jgi:hypothetical protein
LSRPISDADGVLAVFVNWSRGIGDRRAADPIVFAAWPNGYVVWSDNQVEGGPPYHEGRIDPKKYEDAVSRLEADGIFENEKLNAAKIGPDSSFKTIIVRSGNRQLLMRSWHELAESSSGKLAATAVGLEALNGRNRLDVLSQQPADYLFYRLVWSDLHRKFASLIPLEGKLTNGKLVMSEGKVSWSELPAPGSKN